MWLLACFTKAADEVEPVVEIAPPPPREVRGAELLHDVEAFVEAVGPLEALPHYALDLSISDVENRYEGRGTITWTNTTGAPVKTLPLLLHPNAPKELGAATTASLELRSATSAGATLRSVRPTLAELDFETPIGPGEVVTIEVEFGGTLKLLRPESNDIWAQASAGMAQGPIEAADYGLLGQGDGLLTAASAFPTVAPWTDGFQTAPPSGIGDLAWNHPVAFEVRVVTPKDLEVVTNLVDTRRFEGEVRIVEGVGVGVRDLVVLASRDFVVHERTVGETAVRSWGLRQDEPAVRAALDDTVLSLEVLEKELVPYPFTELDVVEATLTGGAGGVEFSALILVAGFLYRDPSTSQDPTYQMLQQMGGLGLGTGVPDMATVVHDQRRFVVAHEVAHQWFPGLVGSDAHSQPALDEPLAQYLAGRVLGEDLRDRSVKANFALYRLMDGKDGAAARPTSSFGSTLEYAALVYGKAPYLYVDLEDEGLDLAAATREHAWKTTTTDAWLATLAENGAPAAETKGRRWWKEAWGDEDFGLDQEGYVALSLLLGEEMAEGLIEGMKFLGMGPKDLFAMLGSGAVPIAPPTAPGEQPTPEEMMELLDALK